MDGYADLPDNLVTSAINNYQYSQSASPEEKMIIRQYRYAEDNGPFSVSTDQLRDTLNCTLSLSDGEYTVEIPKHRDSVKTEVYPIGQCTYSPVNLVGVSLNADLPWCKEAFIAYYFGKINEESVNAEDESFQKDAILTQYYVPRKLTSDPPFESVVTNKSENSKFEHRMIEMVTKDKPNPWFSYAVMVIYENSELAMDLLSKDECRMNNDEYSLTPPEDIPNYN